MHIQVIIPFDSLFNDDEPLKRHWKHIPLALSKANCQDFGSASWLVACLGIQPRNIVWKLVDFGQVFPTPVGKLFPFIIFFLVLFLSFFFPPSLPFSLSFFISLLPCETVYPRILPNKNSVPGLPWWRSGWESACQCRGHGFEPWSGKIPHAAEQLGLWTTTTEPARLEPVLRNKRGRDSERPAHCDEEWPPLATTRESPHTEVKTQHSQK